MLSRLAAYVRGLVRRNRIDAEADDELRFHLEMETRAHIARGVPPAEARRAALRDLGGVTPTKEAIRDVRTIGVETAWRDAILAIRRLGRTPGLTAGAILTLVVGLGAASAIFSLADPMLVRSLPYPEAERIVTVEMTGPEVFGRQANVADLQVFEREAETVELVSTYTAGPRGYFGETAQTLAGMRVSPNLLRLFGVEAAAGRLFSADEYGRDARVRPRVAVITWRLWQDAFGGRIEAVGSPLTLTEPFMRVGPSTLSSGAEIVTLEVVGVLPRSFAFPDGRIAPPAFLVPAGVDPSWAGVPTRGIPILARRRPGVDVSRVTAELTHLSTRAQLAFPSLPAARAVHVLGLQDHLFADLRRPLVLLFAAAATVLLLTFVNLSHLMMASLRTRAHEMAVRRALGSSTSRLIRLVVAEAGWICLFAAIGGLAAGQALLSWVMRQSPEFGYVYRLIPAGIDGRGVLFAAVLALVGLVVIVARPVWRLTRAGAHQIGANVARHERGRVGDAAWLVGLQAAFAVAILAAGVLTVKSFAVLVLQPRGYDPSEIKSLAIRLPPSVLSDPALMRQTHRGLVDAFARVPGVAAVAMAASVPGLLTSGSIVDESTGQPIENLWVHRVGGGFAAAAGLRLEAGRFFSDDEAYGGAGVAIVDRRTADRLWAGGEALGHTLRERNGRTSRVVGVVATVSQTLRTDVPQPGLVLTPLASSEYSLTIVARFADRPPMAAIREAARRVDDRLRIGAPVSHATYERFVGQPRFLATVVGGLGVIAGLLVATGVFAVASHVVLRRRREIAVRVALGATPAAVRRLLFSHAVTPALAGTALGTIAVFWWARGLESVLVGVTPRDMGSYLAAAVLSLLAMAAGMALPARRASRVDPAATLRSE